MVANPPRDVLTLYGIDYPFTLDNAAILIPMTVGALRKFLSRHKDEFPQRYRRGMPGAAQRKRILYASEILKIRDHYIDTKPYHPNKAKIS